MKESEIDAIIGNYLVEVKIGPAGLRSLQTGLMQLASALGERPHTKGYLVLSDTRISDLRIQKEARRALDILRKDIASRIIICTEKVGKLAGVLQSIDLDLKSLLLDVVEKERAKKGAYASRSDAAFVILKVLLHQWLTSGEAVTSEWLMHTSGYSYPTVANVLQSLGSLIERQSNRKVRFQRFPHDEYLRLIAMADRSRASARYVDASGQPQSPEKHLRRLETLNPKGVAIGGVFGAKHYVERLDIVGAPRLDLSFHSRDPKARPDFVRKLDPALTRITDPHQPASLVVHNVHHADPLFVPREGGLKWADPVECLLDLHEARLEMQATQFLEVLRRRRLEKQ